jgi:type IV pilus assembly protein PilC
MATAASIRDIKEFVYEWEGKDRHGKIVRGEVRASGENQVQATLRRQGVFPTKIKKRRMRSGKSIKPKDIALFTRQLATMMKAGVPLLQSFDIVGRGNTNASVTKLLNDIRTDVETGTSLNAAFRKHPMYFDSLYCNLVEAGEAAGILEALLDRLATYMEKTEAIKSKIKSALMYPISVVIVAFVVVAVIMIFVIPAFKEVLGVLVELSISSCKPGSEMRKFKNSWTVSCLKSLFLALSLRNPALLVGRALYPPCSQLGSRWSKR